jgi:uncharacterized protein affecting Mg2+/Co2+ transport
MWKNREYAPQHSQPFEQQGFSPTVRITNQGASASSPDPPLIITDATGQTSEHKATASSASSLRSHRVNPSNTPRGNLKTSTGVMRGTYQLSPRRLTLTSIAPSRPRSMHTVH